MEDADCPNFSEATSDSDCELQDLDEDEDFFASADIPKLQLRYLLHSLDVSLSRVFFIFYFVLQVWNLKAFYLHLGKLSQRHAGLII